METRETRLFRVELRADEDGTRTAFGHASTFNEPYPIADFEEQVAPGAFRNTLEDPKWHALWNHDDGNVLGRPPKTARAEEDGHGLAVEVDMPKSALREIDSLERGDVTEMSFAFTPNKESWAKRDGLPDLRTLEEVTLYDVSFVRRGANPKTDVAIRSYQEWKETQKPDLSPIHAARKRKNELQIQK